jgi:hypothetical protein
VYRQLQLAPLHDELFHRPGAAMEGAKEGAAGAVAVGSAIAMRGRGVSLGGDAGKDEAGGVSSPGLSTHTPVGSLLA